MPPTLTAAGLFFRAQQLEPWLLEHLRALVEIESPTEDKAAVDRAVAWTVAFAESLVVQLPGLRLKIRWHKQREFGDLLELRFAPARRSSRARPAAAPVLMLGHLDTVWPMGTLAKMPWREASSAPGKTRIGGPGVLDMKFGVVQALTAIRLLAEADALAGPVTVLLVSEEEVGSPVSRPVTERVAREHAAVFVLEPAQGLALKTARKGVGDYTLTVHGVAAHAGVDFTAGHSAVLELARQIERVAALTDLKRGMTFNPGVIAGGTRSNVVAAEASVEIDVRIVRAADAARVERLLRRLKPVDPACSLTLTGGINRPPMERKPGTVRLYRQARRLAAELTKAGARFSAEAGGVLAEAATGGGSDGNFTAALGIPTLDGLGAVGMGAHAPTESIEREHVAARVALLAGLLAGM